MEGGGVIIETPKWRVSSKRLNESAEGAVAIEVVRADAPKARYLSPKSA